MNIRLYNARILTMEKNKPVFRGEIWVKNEKIAYIASREELAGLTPFLIITAQKDMLSEEADL